MWINPEDGLGRGFPAALCSLPAHRHRSSRSWAHGDPTVPIQFWVSFLASQDAMCYPCWLCSHFQHNFRFKLQRRKHPSPQKDWQWPGLEMCSVIPTRLTKARQQIKIKEKPDQKGAWSKSHLSSPHLHPVGSV